MMVYECRNLSTLQVNTKYKGKGAIHIAVVEGFVPVLRTLLQFHPDLEMEVPVY